MKLRRAYIFRGHFPINASTNCQIETYPIYQTFRKNEKSRRVDRSQRPIEYQMFQKLQMIEFDKVNSGEPWAASGGPV